MMMDDSPAFSELRNFHAQAVLDQEVNYTVIGGRFSPSERIDLTRQAFILSIAGDKHLRLTLSAGTFRETGLGGYVAHGKGRLFKSDILLQPFRDGDWTYSVGIQGFVPESTLVTVTLRIGSQAGQTTAKAYSF